MSLTTILRHGAKGNEVERWQLFLIGRGLHTTFIRGSRTTLNNHAFGSVFDINLPCNVTGWAKSPPPPANTALCAS